MALKDKLMTLEDFKAVRDVDVASNSAQFTEIKADLNAADKYSILLNDEVPNTTQAYTFSNGSVSQVIHSHNNTPIRTDVFTYSSSSITEVRTLNTGESLTIVTNLATLETTVSYSNH